jgi:hypothetical protein
VRTYFILRNIVAPMLLAAGLMRDLMMQAVVNQLGGITQGGLNFLSKVNYMFARSLRRYLAA